MTRTPLKIVVVVPTYNEKDNLPTLIRRIQDLNIPELVILIVDDDSPDGTGQLANTLASDNPGLISVLHRTTKNGLGRAYLAGISHALHENADIIIQMDADLSHPPEAIPTMLAILQNTDTAMVIGSRYVPGGTIAADWAWHRKALSAAANWYVNAVLRLGVKDATAGFKAWKAATLNTIDLPTIRSNGYSFQVEMNYRTTKNGLIITETPIRFEERTTGTSKMSLPVQIESALMPWKLLLTTRPPHPHHSQAHRS